MPQTPSHLSRFHPKFLSLEETLGIEGSNNFTSHDRSQLALLLIQITSVLHCSTDDTLLFGPSSNLSLAFFYAIADTRENSYIP
jgi:hypothetical protein